MPSCPFRTKQITTPPTLPCVSVFLTIGREHWVGENELAFAIRDRYPVAPGHTLIITKRVTPTWFDATSDEQRAIFEIVDQVKTDLDAEFSPDAYNVGFNAGAAAGQTVDHLHVHVIPRYVGDMADPRGGVRHVIPHKGNYLAGPSTTLQPPAQTTGPDLVTTDGRLMLLELLRCLGNDELNRIDLLVSFIKRSGFKHLRSDLDKALSHGATVRVLTTNYLGITDARALRLLHDRAHDTDTPGTLEVRIFDGGSTSFHPKAYLFSSDATGHRVGFVGSSNLSDSALTSGVEWNLRTPHTEPLVAEFDRLWNDRRSIPLTHEWLVAYETDQAAQATQTPAQPPGPGDATDDIDTFDAESPEELPTPRRIQVDVLSQLAATRADGHKAGLVVLATGLGKTWVSAFDAASFDAQHRAVNDGQPTKILFVAHRREILLQARDVFAQVLPHHRASMWVDTERDPSGDIVFASIAGLHRHLDDIAPDAFDYVVVDEFHHADAPTYRRLIAHLRPAFLLGLTATPERSDGADLLALCADNLVAEVDLREGINLKMLVPFRYRGIVDTAEYAHLPWRSKRFDPDALTSALTTEQRVRQVFHEWTEADGANRRAIGFCSSIRHADYMAQYFRSRGIDAVAVHASSSSAPRGESLERLRLGELPIIFTVDVFNEGVDIPDVDLVLFLRPTDSPIVFFQQLGRGLRTAPNKSHLDVLDFVANHECAKVKIRLLGELAAVEALSPASALRALTDNTADLPDGCEIILDLELVDLLRTLVGPPTSTERAVVALEHREVSSPDHRPTALEVALTTGRAHQFKADGGWFGFLHEHGRLSEAETRVWKRHRDFFVHLEHGSYTKSYKLVTLQVLIGANALATGLPLNELADTALWLMDRNPALAADYGPAKTDLTGWRAHWKKNPVAAWTNPGAGGTAFFTVDAERRFVPTFDVGTGNVDIFTDMTNELVGYRLHRYLTGLS